MRSVAMIVAAIIGACAHSDDKGYKQGSGPDDPCAWLKCPPWNCDFGDFTSGGYAENQVVGCFRDEPFCSDGCACQAVSHSDCPPGTRCDYRYEPDAYVPDSPCLPEFDAGEFDVDAPKESGADAGGDADGDSAEGDHD